MAIAKNNVKLACNILLKVFPNCLGVITLQKKSYYIEIEFPKNFIICWDKKADGGFENIYIEVGQVSEEQNELFESLKKKVPNSAVVRKLDNGLIHIGWF